MRKKKKKTAFFFFFITAVQMAKLMPHALTMRQVPHEVVFRLAPLLFFSMDNRAVLCFFFLYVSSSSLFLLKLVKLKHFGCFSNARVTYLFFFNCSSTAPYKELFVFILFYFIQFVDCKTR